MSKAELQIQKCTRNCSIQYLCGNTCNRAIVGCDKYLFPKCAALNSQLQNENIEEDCFEKEMQLKTQHMVQLISKKIDVSTSTSYQLDRLATLEDSREKEDSNETDENCSDYFLFSDFDEGGDELSYSTNEFFNQKLHEANRPIMNETPSATEADSDDDVIFDFEI